MALVAPKKPDLEVPVGQQLLFEQDQQDREVGAPSTYQESLGSQGENERVHMLGEHIAGPIARIQRDDQRFTTEAINQMARFVNETRSMKAHSCY